jgi:phospholipase/lecithinase/hemolysin
MSNILRRTRRTLLALCLTLGASFAAQAAYSNVYFFGDSLSDTGNVYTAAATANIIQPPPPYYDGRFSNGPLWVEYLAAGLGNAEAAKPFQLGGNNYAWAGAMTDTNGLADGLLGISTGLQAQVTNFWGSTHATASANDLFVIAIGGNDLFGIAAAFPDAADAAARQIAAQMAVNNVMTSLNELIAKGASNFLIATAPNIGVTPDAIYGGIAPAATDVSMQYNALLAAAIAGLNSNINVTGFDLFSLVTELVDDAANGGALYGLGNGVTPCIMTGLDTCNDAVFFDGMHPTAIVHAMAGQAALATIAANQVPEPATWLLLATTVLLIVRRHQRTAARQFTTPAVC